MSEQWEYAIFRKRDAIDYPDPFDPTLLPSEERAEEYMRSHYKEPGWKWLEIRKRPAPIQWTRCEP